MRDLVERCQGSPTADPEEDECFRDELGLNVIDVLKNNKLKINKKNPSKIILSNRLPRQQNLTIFHKI